MKARPILFSAPMVLANLQGKKSQTRRVFKIAGYTVTSPQEAIERFHDGSFHYLSPVGMSGPYHCPYGEPGDLLWVRETWAPTIAIRAFYRATDEKMLRDDGWKGKWTPAIHMPRNKSRMTLRITDVRVQRLQEISEDDAKAEGTQIRDIMYPDEPRIDYSYIAQYRLLWNRLNGPGSWEANPWVWAISYEVIKQNVDEVLKVAA